LEGALGKISAKSNRAPKQAIQVAPANPGVSTPLLNNTLSSLADLKYAEEIVDAIICLESFDHGKPLKEVAEKEERYFKIYFREDAKVAALNDLWKVLAPSVEVPSTIPHPLVCCLNRSKGLEAVSRGLLLLDAKQSLGFFSVLFKRIECLNVMNFALGKNSEKVI
jgi:Topoisomerase II-associated protein PAT1